MTHYPADDLGLLLPSFQPIAGKLLATMTELGFEPVPFDTARTPTEAAANAVKGTGSVHSIHIWGCAMDVICDKHGWQCKAKGCKFYVALGREAKALGLIWGGDWPKGDMPHVQVIPVAWQSRMRALDPGPAGLAARDALVQKYLSSQR